MSRAFVVVGLGYGDEGKGSTVDWLARREGAGLVTFINGGGQRAHTVYTDDGLVHTFRMFGSGTFAGASTHHSGFCLIDPMTLAIEAEELRGLPGIEPEILERVTIHPHAAVTTPWHVALNRLRELSAIPGKRRHGSCGLGIAETVRDVLSGRALRYEELSDPSLEKRLEIIRAAKRAEAKRLPEHPCQAWSDAMELMESPKTMEDTLAVYGTIALLVTAAYQPESEVTIYEGSQGTLLDERVGFGPHNTWSRCTTENAHRLIEHGTETTRLGVLRAYMTRHGRGPLVTEDRTLALAMPEPDNPHNTWQEHMRVGWPDAVMARYAARHNHLNGLVVTCLDHVEDSGIEDWKIATSYRRLSYPLVRQPTGLVQHKLRTDAVMCAEPGYSPVPPDLIPQALSRATGAPLWATSRGPTASSTERLARAHSVR